MFVEMINNLTWYEKLKVLRIIKGWGQRQAGEACFTNNKNYWQWETGKTYPTYINRKLITSAFGLKIEHIFLSQDKVTKSNKNNAKR